MAWIQHEELVKKVKLVRDWLPQMILKTHLAKELLREANVLEELPLLVDLVIMILLAYLKSAMMLVKESLQLMVQEPQEYFHLQNVPKDSLFDYLGDGN